MFCRPLGQNFTIHYVWPWLKAFTGSLSLTFSCQMYYLKVLQNFIESGQESKNGNRNRPLQSATHIGFGEIREDFVERCNSYNCVIISERVTKSFLMSVPDQLFHYDLRTPPAAEVEAQRGGWMEGRRLSHQADIALWARLDFQGAWTRDKTRLLQ